MVSSYRLSWQHHRRMKRDFPFLCLLGSFVLAIASLRQEEGREWWTDENLLKHKALADRCAKSAPFQLFQKVSRAP